MSKKELSACLINCTLKRSPRQSHTDGLIFAAQKVLEHAGVRCTTIRAVDHDLPPGMQPDMTKEGYAADETRDLVRVVCNRDIVVLATPVWLGERSSVCSRVIERLYAYSGEQNERGQPLFYGKVGGCLVTGNEDGAKHAAMSVLYGLQHIGFLVPPESDAAWLGPIGPGPSYLDDESGGPESDFTNRKTTAMAWNMVHAARMLRESHGVPPVGNQPEAWEQGTHAGHPSAEEIRGSQSSDSKV